MRLLKLDAQNNLTLTRDLVDGIPPYAVLSHTWGRDGDEVTFADLQNGLGETKPGYDKIRFCGERAKKDGFDHFWVDTCCIDKTNNTELSEAIVSMFRWYRNAEKCYVYLSDVPSNTSSADVDICHVDQSALRNSRWFKRGWTLQELLAPKSVEFFSQDGNLIGSKITLLQPIHEITGIPVAALQGAPLSHYSVTERLQWASQRQTKRAEDRAYCLLGIFDVFLPLIYGEGDNAFERLQEAIKKQLNVPRRSIHTHWCVSRPSNSLFTGRESILGNLEHLIREYMARSPEDEQCRIVITGIGGQGKSELCLQLAHRLRNLFWAVLWIDVNTEADAKRSFMDVARKLSLSSDSWEDARHDIANLKHPWMMILDNADDITIDYSVYFPDGNPGVVILTSRNDECQQYASAERSSINLVGLALEDARGLLLKSARASKDHDVEYEEAAEVVATLLQFHALALIQAGAYISNGHCTLDEYPHAYERQRKRLLSFRPKQARSRYGDVYATFEVSVDFLKNSTDEVARDALQLLYMLAVCGPTRLPVVLFEAAWHGAKSPYIATEEAAEDAELDLLTTWHVSQIPAFLNVAYTEWDPFRLNAAIKMLRSMSLIMTDSQDGNRSVSMHTLVHAWARDRQSPHEIHQSWLRMACVMVIPLRSDQKILSYQHMLQLQSHCEAATLWDTEKMYANEPSNLVSRILVWYGWHLLTMSNNDAQHTLRLVQNVLQHLNLDISRINESYIGLYDLAGAALRSAGQAKNSVTLLESLVHIRKRFGAEDNRNRRLSQYNLAMAYFDNRQLTQAITLLESVAQVEERVLAEISPDRLKTQHELAMAYRDDGQLTEAIILLEHVVKVQGRTLAEDHPDRMVTQHNLAIVYKDNGQLTQAITLLEHVVKVRGRTLAEDHSGRLASQHYLALLYGDNGQLTQAITLLEHVVKVRGRTLAEDHSDQLATQHNLAMVYRDSGQLTQAITLLEHVVKVQGRTLAEDHSDRLTSQHNLALLYERAEHFELGYSMMANVVEIAKYSLAEDDPNRKLSEAALRAMQVKMAKMRAESGTKLKRAREDDVEETRPSQVLKVSDDDVLVSRST